MQTQPLVAEEEVDHTPARLRVKGKALIDSLEKISAFVLRYGLVLVVFWIGCLKFTAYESKGVFNHASHSPLLAWAYHILDVRDFSRGLGAIEITIALLIAIGPVWPKLSIVGSVGGIGMFLTTLSFVITTPGVWQAGYGFPALAASPGQFLVKDVVLLGAAIWTLADSLRYVVSRPTEIAALIEEAASYSW
jgi:reactive chlorine resistance protein C